MFRRLLLSLLATTLAFAHAVVRPPESTAGQTQQYTLRVPNEKQIVTTTIQLTIPADLKVTKIDDKSGWKLDLQRDSKGVITSATWTGSLAPSADVEFTFSATNPTAPTTLSWNVIQTFQDGSKSEWTGPAGSPTPASRTQIVAPAK